MNCVSFTIFILVCIIFPTDCVQNYSYHTSIILGNQHSSKAEIYQVTFSCVDYACQPLPLTEKDLVWSSPDTEGISEVKFVSYQGRHAVLCTTENGAVVYEYPSGKVLFHKEIESNYYLNIHSAEVLPDGNVIVAGSRSDGVFAVLYPDPNNHTQTMAQTVTVNTPFAHALTYDKTRNLLYAGGYLTILTVNYTSGSDGRGSFQVVTNTSIATQYDEPNKNEDATFEDGIHDLYPVDKNLNIVFLTTGEHVYMLSVKDFSVHKFVNLHAIASQKSNNRSVSVKDKGGVKAVSMDATNGLVIAKASPWFKEYFMGTYDDNYNPYEAVVLWATARQCSKPGYDVGDRCKLNFDDLQPIWFYKARLFMLPSFSY